MDEQQFVLRSNMYSSHERRSFFGLYLRHRRACAVVWSKETNSKLDKEWALQLCSTRTRNNTRYYVLCTLMASHACVLSCVVLGPMVISGGEAPPNHGGTPHASRLTPHPHNPHPKTAHSSRQQKNCFSDFPLKTLLNLEAARGRYNNGIYTAVPVLVMHGVLL